MPEEKSGPGLFEGTASYYSRYRFGYPDSLFDHLVSRFALDHTTYVLDLGCGTGQLAVPFANRGIPVRAVDPDVDMLAEGMRVEQGVGTFGVEWQRGDDRNLDKLTIPSLRLCVMGASFHWTDRDVLLTRLDSLIKPSGAVVVVDGGKGIWFSGERDWSDIAKEVVQEFLGPERRAGAGTYTHPKDRHEAVLGRSVFSSLERVRFSSSKRLSIGDIIGLQLSTSYASPAQLGNMIEAFKQRLHDRLMAIAPEGVFEGSIGHDVLIATRP